MKKLFLISVEVLFFSIAVAQPGIDNLWIMGENGSMPHGPTNVDFISGTPNAYSVSRSMNIAFTNGLISDSTGNLLFYTNGCYIANALNDTMFNGDSLNPGVCTNNYCSTGEGDPQGNLVVPFPNSKNKYYLFHKVCDQNAFYHSIPHPTKLYYSVIDMEQQAGLGAVTEKNVVVVNTNNAIALNLAFLVATKHANGRDWWIVTHGLNNNIFYTLLVTPDGVQGPFMQTIGPSGSNDGGEMTVFSPDGSKLVTCAWAGIDTNGFGLPEVHVFDFDRCTGQFSNYHFDSFYNSPPYYFGGGVAISPNSKYLYYTGVSFGLVQYDLNAPNLTSARTQIVQDTASLYLIHLAYDQKIYIMGPTVSEFSSINYPDSGGLACGFQFHTIQLPHPNHWTIPNYPNYRLGALTGSSCDTITNVNEINAFQLKLSVYPNPSEEGVFHFKFNDARDQIKGLEVSDITGRVIYTLYKNSYEINLSNVASGVYFYSVKTNNGKLFNGKLVRE